MAGLENINEVVGQKVWSDFERLLKDLDASAAKMIETSKVFKNNPISISGGSGSTKEDVAQINKLISAQKEYQKITESASKSIQQSRRNEIAGTKELLGIQKEAARQTDVLTNDYAQLSKAYNEAALRAKNYTIQLGANNAVTLEAVADAKRLGDTLKNIDASVGQNQRNVGNYSGALTGLQFSIRNIASELPNLGISLRTFAQSLSNNITPFAESVKGIIAQNRILASEGKPTVSVLKQIGQGFFSLSTFVGIAIIAGLKLIEFFGKAQGSAALAEKANKKYADSIEKVAETSRSSANEEISQLTVLTTLAADNAQTTRTRTRAVKELQETYPETFGALTQQQILEGKLGDAVRLTTQALLDRAAAQAAEKRFAAASEKIYDLTIAQRKATDDLRVANAKLNSTIAGSDKEERGLNQFNLIQKRTQLTKDLSEINDQVTAAQKEQAQFLRDAQNSAAAAGDLYFNNQPKSKAVKDTSAKELRQEMREEDQARKDRLAAEKEYQDALRNNRNAAAEENIQVNKEIFENENESLSNRLEAYQEYYTGKQNQARSNADKELADIVQLEAEIRRVEAEDESHRSAADKALLLRKEGISERRKGIEIKLAADEAKISEESARDILRIQESYSKQQIAILEARLLEEEDLNDRARLTQMQNLLSQAKEGLISWRDYQYQKTQVSKDAQANQLESENVQLFNEIERTDLTQEAKEKLIKKYYENLDRLRKINLAKDEDEAEQAIRREREKRDAMFSIAESGLNALSGILSADAEKEKQRNDAAKDALDYRYDQEAAAIKSNGDTKEQQELALADLEKNRATEKRELDKEQAIRNRDLAVQQKQIAILAIILNTSLAVIKAYTEGDPYTKIARAIAAGAAGAAQLAVAIAAPVPDIPAYKEGTGLNLHKGGDAIVGDGYVPEWIKEPGKKGYWSPAQPVKLNLSRGTSVTTPDQLAAMATRDAIRQIASNGGSVTEGIYTRQMIAAFESLIGETKGVKKAIGSKPTHNTILTERGLKSSQKRGNSWTTYIDHNVRN